MIKSVKPPTTRLRGVPAFDQEHGSIPWQYAVEIYLGSIYLGSMLIPDF